MAHLLTSKDEELAKVSQQLSELQDKHKKDI